MKRTLILLLSLLLAGVFIADTALARSQKRFWSRYDATVICDIATTTVLIHNPSKVAVSVVARLTDAVGDTQQVLTIPAEGVTSFDCTSLGITGTGVLSFEGPFSLHATAAYQSPGGVVDVERIVPASVSGRRFPTDDSDTGDSDSASGDPTPSP